MEIPVKPDEIESPSLFTLQEFINNEVEYTPLKISNGTNATVYLSKLDITGLCIF
jgi:hypothetical protein